VNYSDSLSLEYSQTLTINNIICIYYCNCKCIIIIITYSNTNSNSLGNSYNVTYTLIVKFNVRVILLLIVTKT